jgi:GNAT superfamily N-acetyltransferase
MTVVIILVAMTTVIEGAQAADTAAARAAPPPAAAQEGAGRARPGVRIADVGPGDRAALEALFARCSPETVRLRFFGFQRVFPEEYADALLAGRPEEHDAVLAYPAPHHGDGADSLSSAVPYACGDAHPVGLASLAAVPGAGPPAAELGVLVCDGWQRQGVGSALVAALIARARERGVVAVSASVLPGRTALLRAMTRRLATLGLVAPPPPAHEPPFTSPPPAAPPPAAPVSYAWTDGSLTAVYRLSEPFPQGRRTSRPGPWHSSRQKPSPYA